MMKCGFILTILNTKNRLILVNHKTFTTKCNIYDHKFSCVWWDQERMFYYARLLSGQS